MNPSRLREASFGSDRLELLHRLESLEREDRRRSFLSEHLLHHPDDDSEDRDPIEYFRTYGGVDYVGSHLRMIIWISSLLVGYACTRFLCHLGTPKDCLRQVTYLEFYSDMTNVLLYGLALGWFTSITEPSRFSWLYSSQRWYVGAVFLAFLPVYSLVSDIPGIQFSIKDTSEMSSTVKIAVLALAMTVFCLAVLWHVVRAWKLEDYASFTVYVATRAVILLWFAVSAVVLMSHQDAHVHIHHLFLGWGLAVWANQNDPVSGITLAVGSALFIQGVGSYSFAPIFLPGGCFETDAASHVSCVFSSDKGTFNMRICPAEGSIPSYDCQY